MRMLEIRAIRARRLLLEARTQVKHFTARNCIFNVDSVNARPPENKSFQGGGFKVRVAPS